jgi:hypothetical protein
MWGFGMRVIKEADSICRPTANAAPLLGPRTFAAIKKRRLEHPPEQLFTFRESNQ